MASFFLCPFQILPLFHFPFPPPFHIIIQSYFTICETDPSRDILERLLFPVTIPRPPSFCLPSTLWDSRLICSTFLLYFSPLVPSSDPLFYPATWSSLSLFTSPNTPLRIIAVLLPTFPKPLRAGSPRSFLFFSPQPSPPTVWLWQIKI